jgi:hypothetical protein
MHLLVAVRVSASAQLVSSNLLSCHDGGGVEKAVEEVAEERKGAQRERSRQAKQAQPVD